MEKTIFDEFNDLIRMICQENHELPLKHQAIKVEVMMGVLRSDLDNLCMLVDSLKDENDSLKDQIETIQAIADNDLDDEGLSLHQRFSIQTQMQTLEQASRDQLLDVCKMLLLNLYQRDNSYKNIIKAQWGFLEV